MYGAILGDIVGSRYEFTAGPDSRDFRFVNDLCEWTDDTVMTIAIADALMKVGKDANISDIKKECITSMKSWGRKYRNAGYGGKFVWWILLDDENPYNSFGNGSAMRVSSVGWFYDSLERTREVARATAEVTHNHPEGIKGAECTAAVIYLARTGAGKEEIRKYVEQEFGYEIPESVEEAKKFRSNDETCMDAMPKALVAFYEGDSYIDVVRNAVYMGGDTDTIAAIAGSMAEGFFGMDVEEHAEVDARIEDDMRQVLTRFNVYRV